MSKNVTEHNKSSGEVQQESVCPMCGDTFENRQLATRGVRVDHDVAEGTRTCVKMTQDEGALVVYRHEVVR